jgi:5-methylcytosine-specific restriction endonuclease McrA
MTKRLEFSPSTKRKAYELRDGKCPGLVELRMPCGKDLVEDCEYDHIKRCEIEPDNSLENCRPLCRNHHLIKTAMDAKQAAKGRRIRGENKPKRKAKINSPGFPSKEERERLKQRYAR